MSEALPRFPKEGHAPRHRGPQVDQLQMRSLYTKEEHEVVTADGWTLLITRYKPVPQAWHQPLLHVPILLVHGLSQNRHAWTAGEFVKNLLYFGIDVHILELRGHGKSSVALQRSKAADHVRPLPLDLAYEWDFGAYMNQDVPAAIEVVKRLTGWDRIALCGHSMGGIIGYGLASQRNDLLCLATIGTPVDLSVQSIWLRMAAQVDRLIPAVQGAIGLWNQKERLRAATRSKVPLLGTGQAKPRLLNAQVAPLDTLLGTVYRSMVFAREWTPQLTPKPMRLFNPKRVSTEAIQWLLQQGCEKEPVSVIRTFAKWIRRRELKCYQTGYDIKGNFSRIKLPLTIVFGDQDIFSGLESTRAIYATAQSDYLVWRPVRGNSHVEVTMGHDIRQICYDVKNLIDYSLNHQDQPPSLPRVAD